MHTFEFTCQDCGEDILTNEAGGIPVCVTCRDTRRLGQEAKPAGLDDATVCATRWSGIGVKRGRGLSG